MNAQLDEKIEKIKDAVLTAADNIIANGNAANGKLQSNGTLPVVHHDIVLHGKLPATEGSTESDESKGLKNPKAFLFLVLWYVFSAFTLFMNKQIVEGMKGEPTLLSTFQMTMTALLGWIQMYITCGMYTPVKRESKPPNFYRNMIVVGCFRFVTVFLGLIALKYVAVSFTETVKSSAPIFTVLITYMIMREKTGLFTQLSLIPIMAGLALCSAYELSFHILGFLAALGTNLTECIQNVCSKLLISGQNFKYTAGEMQFYTSLASVVIQVPFAAFMLDIEHAQRTTDTTMLMYFILNGVFFHFQTICAYVLMDYICPVTHSVANTVKRAILIWLSVIWFGNPVTILSGIGTMIVTFGVLLYNKAKEHDDIAASATPTITTTTDEEKGVVS